MALLIRQGDFLPLILAVSMHPPTVLTRMCALVVLNHLADRARDRIRSHDMAFQYGRELFVVLGLQQRIYRAGRQLCEGGIGGREDGEWSFALKRFDQAGSLHRGHQGCVILRVHGIVDDVLFRIHRSAADFGVIRQGHGREQAEADCCGKRYLSSFI